jgi:protein-tyrosine phosphatase
VFLLEAFNKYDHITGAINVRLHRFFLHLVGKSDVSFIQPNLFVGGANKISTLSKEGFNAILDLRDDKEDDPHELEKHSIDYLRIKIPDRNVPSVGEAYKAISWIKSNLEKGKKTLVHCNLGRGRASLIVSTYLISQGMPEIDIVRLLKENRKYVFLNSKQLKWIYEFKKYV